MVQYRYVSFIRLALENAVSSTFGPLCGRRSWLSCVVAALESLLAGEPPLAMPLDFPGTQTAHDSHTGTKLTVRPWPVRR